MKKQDVKEGFCGVRKSFRESTLTIREVESRNLRKTGVALSQVDLLGEEKRRNYV